MKADDSVIDAIIRADSRDNDMVSAWTKVELLELFFHGRLIETIMGILFYHDLVGMGLQLLNEFYGGTVLYEGVWFAEVSELRMVLWSNGLNMNDLSIGVTETVQKRSKVFNDWPESRPMPLAAFSLHVDNDKASVFSGKLDCLFFVHEKPPFVNRKS